MIDRMGAEEAAVGNGSSYVPPPSVDIPTDIRPKCLQLFTTIAEQNRTMLAEVREVRKDVKDFRSVQAEQGRDIRNAWHAIRDDIQPAIKDAKEDARRAIERVAGDAKDAIREVKTEARDALRSHENGCPARARAMIKAKSDSGDIEVAKEIGREISRVVDLSGERAGNEITPRGIPRVAWVVGATIAVAVVVGLVLVKAFGLIF